MCSFTESLGENHMEITLFKAVQNFEGIHEVQIYTKFAFLPYIYMFGDNLIEINMLRSNTKV